MLIYSECATSVNKNDQHSVAKSIRDSVFDVKTSKRPAKLSKKNKNFLHSLGLNLKKK